MEILIALIGIAIGFAVGYFIFHKDAASPADQPIEDLAPKLAAAEATVAGLREQIENFAAERKAREAKDVEEQKILLALKPIDTQIDAMQRKITELETQRNTQYGAIDEQLKNAVTQTQALGKQTETLAKAMSDNQMRGVWGEVQLRRLVEEAGLISLADFSEQTTDLNTNGSQRPDMILRLPGGKHIAIDSKVPFDAYQEASSISDLSSPEELARRDALLKKHAERVRAHVKALGNKKYWEGLLDSPPFVVAFIPSESLLSAALQIDPTLLEDAFKQGVALASPVSLFSVLKTVAFIWRQSANEQALSNVIKLGKEIYDRISVIAKHAAKLGIAIDSSVDKYNAFAKSLESNLLTSARKANEFDLAQFGELDAPELLQITDSVHNFGKKELTTEAIEAEIIDNEEDSI